jgi:hypothetical protein
MRSASTHSATDQWNHSLHFSILIMSCLQSIPRGPLGAMDERYIKCSPYGILNALAKTPRWDLDHRNTVHAGVKTEGPGGSKGGICYYINEQLFNMLEVELIRRTWMQKYGPCRIGHVDSLTGYQLIAVGWVQWGDLEEMGLRSLGCWGGSKNSVWERKPVSAWVASYYRLSSQSRLYISSRTSLPPFGIVAWTLHAPLGMLTSQCEFYTPNMSQT